MPNCNPETGIAYGVIDARKAHGLWDEILQDGTNLTLADAEDEVKQSLINQFQEFDADEYYAENDLEGEFEDAAEQDDLDDRRKDAMRQWLAGCIDKATYLSKSDSEHCAAAAAEVIDMSSGTFDIDELVDEVMSALNEEEYFNTDSGEDTYSYQDGGFRYGLSCLGGAPMIWVYKSPYATHCRTCSPCVPGAGDLDNCVVEGEANCFAYCLDPMDIDDEADRPERVYRVDEQGEMLEIVYEKKETE